MTSDPTWNESFTFKTKGLHNKEKVVLALQEYDRFCHQVEVGIVSFELQHIKYLTASENPRKVWRDILPRNVVSLTQFSWFYHRSFIVYIYMLEQINFLISRVFCLYRFLCVAEIYY